ncbi:putative mannosyltransferase-II [Leptomonas pyrrhocoris]|uniref:GPI mannosyltransferase 2 n=1 Tax=Leptomonas pyrrhocoris TaxID=157538 RepID=A0A0M9FYI4_LEPPY|nr:putative mannosyltransferase-II [Leptomonas pyrrhocoris]KPA78583.1 putative mannosyltransferase-II [Leptomonas pyrrhocoris]|eukprot:XP_015657022.1 putative mannosyltransferase-II [Leptomonas pyrrhocoris]
MSSAGPLRAVGGLARRLAATTLEVYSGSPFNLLDYLGSCTDAALFGWIALTRLSLLLLMWFSRTAAPLLFRAPGRSFIFDTGEELYDDARFAMVRQWDGVHMFFIAHYGYLYENQLVFFPGLPALIRGVAYVTQTAVPMLHKLAPVALYVCVVNVVASCLAGVLLRRLAILTFLGPEAVLHTCRWRRRSRASSSSSVTRVTEAAIRYRLLHGLTGTSLDAADPQATLPTTTKAVRTELRRRRRVIGAAALLWIFTPSMVFTVAVYTESLFALTTMLGVYCLAWYEPLPWAVQERMAGWPSTTSATTSATRRPEDEDAVVVGPASLDDVLSDLTGGSRNWPTVVWKQVLITPAETAALLLFTLAATLRSNAFTYAGFLAFPVVVQLILPELYAAQCRTTLTGQRAKAILSAATAPANEDLPGQTSSQVAEQAQRSSARSPPNTSTPRARKAVVCRALSCPQRRLPHPLRALVILLECVVLFLPYLAINYLGYHRFVTHARGASEQPQTGLAFLEFYPTLQKRYWNVSFLSAYTFTNLPNVVLALPVAVLVAMCTHTWYLSPAWEARAGATAPNARSANVTSFGSRFCAAALPWIRSSNVVHLLALLALALAAMHVQVTNRFVMASPALYYLLGAQLAERPTSFLSQLMLMWSILWSIIGGILFANHLPWT